MCGIAGLAYFDGRPVEANILQGMCRALAHRGPDDEGWMTWPPTDVAVTDVSVGLANRRLSVIDLAGGHQPIANETGQIWTVLNGEIYNFLELRRTLEGRGHVFTTHSDTEVITHAYEEFGDACVEQLDGMFALAVWDAPRRRLLLARDRFGKKPLCYHFANGRLTFASELQSLLVAPGIARDIDAAALGDYLAYMAVPAPRTIYRDVHKVPPAHRLVVDASGATLTRYWSLRYAPKLQIRESDAVARIRELLGAAVRRRLISDVPLGAYLSGGVDSSAIVALMTRESGRPVETFSIGFDDPRFNELPDARRVADHCGSRHHEFVVRPEVADLLPVMVRHFGEPFADSSAIPSWYLAQMTRQHVTVALNGDGGDEIFAGYVRHLGNTYAEQWGRLPGALRAPVERLAGARSASAGRGTRLGRFLAAAGRPRHARYRAWAGVFSADLIRDVSSTASPDSGVLADAYADVADLDAVDAILAVDTQFYLPTDLLPKVDITSMAHSLELRSPLLDRELAEFVATLPTALKIKGRQTKYLLKTAMQGLVPEANLRKRKQGFAVPLAGWLRGDLREYVSDNLRSSHVAKAGLVHQGAVNRLLDAHLSEQAELAHQLWTLLMLELWYRTFVTTT